MSTIDTITKEHSTLLAAIEDLHAFQTTVKSMTGVGLESLDSSTTSASMKIALEEQAIEKKQGVFSRLLAFFRRMWETIKSWIEKRKAANRASDDLKAVAEKNKEAKTSVKNPGNPALAKEFEQMAGKLRDDAVALLKNPEFLQQSFPGYAGQYGALSAIAKDSSMGQTMLKTLSSTRSNLEQAMNYHRSSVEAARQGRLQASPQAGRMNEIIAAASASAREFGQTATSAASKPAETVYDLLAAVKNSQFVDHYLRLADTSLLEKALADIEADLGPFLKLFEEIAESDSSQLSGLALKIYEIDPAILMTLAQAPAHFMGVIGRINTATSQITPADALDVQRIAARAVSVASGGKVVNEVNKAAISLVEQHIASQL